MNDEYDKTFGSPSIPKGQPTMKELIKNIPHTAVDTDYTKTMQVSTKVKSPNAAVRLLNGLILKQMLGTVLRESEQQKKKHKIKKADTHWVSETHDNHRGFNFNGKLNRWEYDYDDKALQKYQPQGPFWMRDFQGSTMCQTDYPCTLTNKRLANIPHHDEEESAQALIGDEAQEKRSQDFDGIDIEVEKDNKAVGTGKRQNLPISLLPTVHVNNSDMLTGQKASTTFYPKIISSSFVRKTKWKEPDHMERWYPERQYYEYSGLPLFVSDPSLKS